MERLFEKRLSKSDRDGRFVVPSGWLGTLLPPTSTAEAAGSYRAKVAVHVADEWGKSYTFRLRLWSLPSLESESGRSYYSKPEFMARGWQIFVKEKGLQAGDSVYFWRDRGHIRVKVLPPLEALSKLQVLDLRATHIRELPKGMKNLIHLRYVDLSRTRYLKSIRAKTMSHWTALEVLDMRHSAYHWNSNREIEEGEATFQELLHLKRLVSLSIKLKNVPQFGSECLSWICRLTKFKFFIGHEAENLFPTRHDQRMVVVSKLNLSGDWIKWLLMNTSSLVLNDCLGLNMMLQNLAKSNVVTYDESKSFSVLKSLTITSQSISVFSSSSDERNFLDLLPNLEELHLRGLIKLESITEIVLHLGLLFSTLKLLEVVRCHNIKTLLQYSDVGILQNFETIKVSFCNDLEELFQYVPAGTLDTVVPIFPKLRILELKNLPKLRTISKPEELWRRLGQVDIANCYLLEKLPLTIQNACTINEVRGESHWWSGLTWDNANTKLALQQFFKPIVPL